ncbi:unnamed protein product [Bursaphelenchus xylophilus]|uniref:(pine wood nematode) hypothetical protein n=1 Tax=Bursaphelenchus xylophilus TaxID=6326 RepID=A0A1I7S4P9_BURXY|nr:unnamed protein product [Bursaphelenchus xylophilus]CAG9117285.1 unnamed protein product [Bursaphelenchus xylophilus]
MGMGRDSRSVSIDVVDIEQPSPSEPATDATCKICGISPASPHFGVVSCRPCAAFFRRTVVLKRRYHCNLEGCCNVHHEKRPMCACCRYQKTLEAGMSVQNIRFHSDKIGAPKKKSPRLQSIPPEPEPSTLLTEMTKGYRKFLKRTKELYYIVNPGALFEDKIEYKPATLPEHLIFDRSQLYYMRKMLEKHFHPFGEFSKKDRAKIFELFQPYFTRLNMAYLSVVCFPHIPKRVALFYGGYVDESAPVLLYAQDNAPEESARRFSPVLKKYVVMTEKLKELKADEAEIAAIAGVILWREANIHFNTNKFSDRIDQIIAEMSKYCMGKYSNHESRVGILLCLCRDLEELMIVIRACVVLGEIMNDYTIPYLHEDVFKLAETRTSQ